MRTVRCLPFFSFVLLCLASLGLAQEKPEIAAIRVLESKWVDAYKQRQLAAVASFLTEDYVITLEDGSTYGKTGFISYNAGPLRVEVAELGEMRIRVRENIAVVTGTYHERGVLNGKPYDYHDRLTDVWVKTGGRWQLIASHYSLPANP
jgi:ketosteroid isomerase-like protein